VDVGAFLDALEAEPAYAGQIVHRRVEDARPARYADLERPLDSRIRTWLRGAGIERLWDHQAAAVNAVRRGKDVVVVTGTASGKSLCFHLPLLEYLLQDAGATALLLFPTKALCQDQCLGITAALEAVGLGGGICGVYDGDTPAAARRRLRDRGRVVLTNPDMLHASLLAGHARWSRFLDQLRLLVIDELHVYTGMFGTNVALLMRRVERVLAHYGARPTLVACSATVANPAEHARAITGRDPLVVDRDGAPSGRRTWVLWNPPVERGRVTRSRRSANDEAQDLMARLLLQGAPTITFSKARVTAEMIYRYVAESLRAISPGLERRVAAYRGGYLPEERREIEGRLWSGDLLGVSTTRALELGIDVGRLDAAVIVGYPGTVAALRQQAGRVGRTTRESLVVLVGLDTPVNQYVMRHPEYIFERVVECAVVDPGNPFALMDHLWCAAAELPLAPEEAAALAPEADLTLAVLEEHAKVICRNGRWYTATAEVPHHEVSLRTSPGRNVLITDVEGGAVVGEVGILESISLVHPGAVYIHRGETWRVLELDLDSAIAIVRREQTDHYTQPEGGTDVRHVDLVLRERSFGTGTAHWGEVTVHFRTDLYETVSFHTLDAVSQHGVAVPTLVLETAACWIVPPESLMREILARGLDPHAGLRGVGYATRMLLPVYLTCDTYDFSHSVGSINTPWNTLFIYERFPHGLGFTLRLYERLGEILKAVASSIRECDCRDGCPLCTGKPLRGYATWNVERGEASIPSKTAALAVLDGLLSGPLETPEARSITEGHEALRLRLTQSMSRRLARNREPEQVLWSGKPVEPTPPRGYPAREAEATLRVPDAEVRRSRQKELARRLRKREQELQERPSVTRPDIARNQAVPTDAPLPGTPEATRITPGPGPGPAPPRAPVPDLAELAARARRLKRSRAG
jgi:DEAD/DEAH box helicase domain-containing protein